MDTHVVATYCLYDDLLIAIGHAEDSQIQMAEAEVMSKAVVGAVDCGANFENARTCLKLGN